MTPPRHDPFKHPTIAEALCEIHFVSGPEFWTHDWATQIQNKVKNRFPNLERKEVKQFRAELGPEGFKLVEPLVMSPRSVFKDDQSSTLMQVSPGLLTVNELPPYRGWDKFQADIKFAWETLTELAQIVSVSRIGLRYINRIPRSEPSESVGMWLSKSPFIPECLLSSASRFVSRLEGGHNGSGRLIVTLAEAVEKDQRPIIFDIDTISEKEVKPEWKVVEGLIENLHESAWSVFAGAIGPKLREVLDGR